MNSFDKLIEKRRYDDECIEYRLIGSAISFAFAEIGIGIDETKDELIGNFWLFWVIFDHFGQLTFRFSK
jgi:hypothetical protein